MIRVQLRLLTPTPVDILQCTPRLGGQQHKIMWYLVLCHSTTPLIILMDTCCACHYRASVWCSSNNTSWLTINLCQLFQVDMTPKHLYYKSTGSDLSEPPLSSTPADTNNTSVVCRLCCITSRQSVTPPVSPAQCSQYIHLNHHRKLQSVLISAPPWPWPRPGRQIFREVAQI